MWKMPWLMQNRRKLLLCCGITPLPRGVRFGPLYRLNKPETRQKEFAWLESMGVKGIKVDFFSQDSISTMNYFVDILEDAAKYHLMVNFHGAPIPRGWQRTYPHMMSVEGVYGAEWYNNKETLTDSAAWHNCTLPFTRNVVGPMDYTPCTFYRLSASAYHFERA